MMPVFAQSPEQAKSTSEEFAPELEESEHVDERVKVRSLAAPVYPQSALEKGITGRVVVCFDVDDLGIVYDVNDLESSNDIFDKPTVEAIRASLFSPAVVKGESVDSTACRIFKYWYD
ncbi:MAG: energy transducer TonB [Pseudomonadota bacterium]